MGTIDYPTTSACGSFQAASACFQDQTWAMSLPVELRIFSPKQLSDMTGGPVLSVLKVIGEVVVLGGLSRRK